MGGLFGGGGTTKTVQAPPVNTMSPVQTDYLEQITPYSVNAARLQSDLAQRGTDLLNPSIDAAKSSLPEALQMSGAERAIPGTTRDVYGQGASQLGDVNQSLSKFGNDPVMASIIAKLGGQGQASPGLAGILQQLSQGGENANRFSTNQYQMDPSLMNPLNDSSMEDMSRQGVNVNLPNYQESPESTSIDPHVLLGPMTEQFNEEILPGIRAQALAAGATGGSSEADLTTRASGRFGADAGSLLAQQKAALINAAASSRQADASRYGAQANAALGAGRLSLDDILSRRNTSLADLVSRRNTALGDVTNQRDVNMSDVASQRGTSIAQQGRDTERMGMGGNLEMALQQLGQKGLEAGGGMQLEQGKQGLTAQLQRPAIIQQLTSMGMAPAQAEAALASAERAMSLQRIQAPMSLANSQLSAASGIPGMTPQFNPMQFGGSTSTETPSAGAQAGSAISTAMTMAMMAYMMSGSSAKLKRNIKFIDTPSYLEQLRDIPLAEWNYLWDPANHPKRVGPIRELSPAQIQGPGLTMNTLGYSGLLHAGMKELDAKVSHLEEVLSNAK